MKNKLIVFLLILLSLIAVALLVFSQVNMVIQKSKIYRSITTNQNLNTVDKNQLITLLKSNEWKLEVLIHKDISTSSDTKLKPALQLINDNQILLDLGCNIQYKIDAKYIADDGQIDFFSPDTVQTAQKCISEKVSLLETDYFNPAIGKTAIFYLHDDKLILNFKDKETFFVFSKE